MHTVAELGVNAWKFVLGSLLQSASRPAVSTQPQAQKPRQKSFVCRCREGAAWALGKAEFRAVLCLSGSVTAPP